VSKPVMILTPVFNSLFRHGFFAQKLVSKPYSVLTLMTQATPESRLCLCHNLVLILLILLTLSLAKNLHLMHLIACDT
jgi:hypothetical protein